MPNKNNHKSLSNLPDLVTQLVDEHTKYLKKAEDLSKELDNNKQSIEKQRKIILSVLSDDQVPEDELTTQKPELRNLIRDYVNIRKKLIDINEEFKRFKEETNKDFEKMRSDIRKVESYVKNYGDQTLDDEVSQDLNDLARAIDEFMKNRIDDSIGKIITDIRKSLRGDSVTIPRELEKTINEMIIERLDKLVEPYEQTAYKLTHDEITQEEYIETLKKKALVEQMRSKIIADITHAINQRNISEMTMPTELKKAIDNLIRDQVNYALLMQQKNRN